MKIKQLFLYFFVATAQLLTALPTYDPLLVVVLMVKNEEKVIVPTLAPFVDAGITSYLIFDTGSTDKTIEVTRNYFTQKNITDTQIIQEPFIDFARSRNRALDLAQEKFPSAAFMVMPDAEWYLKDAPSLIQFCKDNLHNPCPVYLIHITSPTINFYHARLFRGNSPVRFEGAVHEVPSYCTNQRVPTNVHFELSVTQEGLEKSARRFHRDVRLLLNSFLNDPTNPRTAFYLAQTYQCLGDLINACKFYEFRLRLNRNDEEHYIATLRLGDLTQERAKQDNTITWQSIQSRYLEAFALRPHRIEPLIKIAQYYLDQGNMALAYLYAQPTLHVPYPENDFLFVEQRLYAFTRYDIIGRAAWYVGQFEIGEQALRKALEMQPDSIHLHRNLSFYIARKEKLATQQKSQSAAAPVHHKLVAGAPEFVAIITSYNNEKFYYRNLDSLIYQKTEEGKEYKNLEIIYINDCSTDRTGELVDKYVKDNHVEHKVKVIHNKTRVGALENLVRTIKQLSPHKIVATIDGDDWLTHDKVFARVEKEYKNPNTWLTYGQYMYYPEGHVGVCKEISQEIKDANKFRKSDWVTSQLRTFRAALFQKIKPEEFLHENKYFSMAWDLAMMYPMLEMAKNHIVFIPDVLYIYNHHNPISDHNISRELQAKLTNFICAREPYKPLDKLDY